MFSSSGKGISKALGMVAVVAATTGAALSTSAGATPIPSTGTFRVIAGGYRNGASNTASDYALPLQGAGLQYSSSSGFASPFSFPLTDASGVATASVNSGSKYYARENTAPTGWWALTHLSWGGSSQPYVGSATVNSGSTSTASVDSDTSTRFVHALNNPVLPSKCGTGLKVLLLLDTSGSTKNHGDAYNHAAKTFVDSLSGTPTTLKISSFATYSSPDNVTQYDLATPAGQAAANSRINTVYPNNTSGEGSTNWDAALKDAAAAGVNVVVFVTDGNPTVRKGTESSFSGGGSTEIDDITYGVASANSAKDPDGTPGNADDQTILAVGVGADLASANLSAVSGPTEGTDYTTSSDPAALAATLKQIAAKICGGTVKITKDLKPADDPGKFNLTIDGVAKPPLGVGNGGSVGPFDLPVGDHTIGEEAGDLSTDLSKYARTIDCSNQHGSISVDQATGKITVNTDDVINCTIHNRRMAGTIKVTKKIDGIQTGDTFNLLVNGEVQKKDAGNGDSTGDVPVMAGANTVTETAGTTGSLSNYVSSTTCSAEGKDVPVEQATGGLSVADGQAVNCTITNRRKTATLEVRKALDPAGDKGLFNLTINGGIEASDVGDGGTTGALTVLTGTNSVGETAGTGTDLAGYSAAIACTDGKDTIPVDQKTGDLQITADGAAVVCTITNTRIYGHLSITKSLDPTSDAGKFDLLINGTTKASGVGDGGTTGSVAVFPGENTVSELGNSTDLSHYSSKWACVDGSEPVTVGAGGKVDVPANHTVDCTVTNTRLPGSLTIVKKIAGPDDGSSRFNFLIDGSVQSPSGLGDGGSVGPVSVSAGSHTVSEEAGNAGTDLANFKQDIACSDKAGTVPNVDGKLTVDSNQDVTCTVTNTRKSGTISIKKLVVWPDPAPADTGKFDLLLNKSVALAAASSGDSTGKITVATGTNTVGENGAGGTDLSNYTAVTTCLDGETPVPVDGDGNLTVKDGQDVACTITNTVRTGTLTIVKSVPGGSTQQFPFAGPLGSFNLTDGGEPKVLTLGPGSWTVSETPVTGFDFTSLNCEGEESQPNTEITGPSVTVALRAGEAVTCTWVNTPSGTPLPGKAGTAVIGGNTGCVTGAYAGFKVRGTFIARVEWYLDGRLIKVANKPNASPYWKKWIRMANVSWGTHRIKAVVRYVTGATPRSKTLTRSFSRLHYCRGVYTG